MTQDYLQRGVHKGREQGHSDADRIHVTCRTCHYNNADKTDGDRRPAVRTDVFAQENHAKHGDEQGRREQQHCCLSHRHQ